MPHPAAGAVVPFTPEGTVGPFYPGYFVASQPSALDEVAPQLSLRPRGQGVEVVLRFIDANRKPVRGVIVESWQANAEGRYRHPAELEPQLLDPQFDGFLRLRSDEAGIVRLRTIKPGAHAVAGSAQMRAPHLRLTLFASGIDRLVTQIFFEGEARNAVDPVLCSIEDPRLRQRLVARRVEKAGATAQSYELTVVLQGEEETPFFDDWQSSAARKLVIVQGDRESETRTPLQALLPLPAALWDSYSAHAPPPRLRLGGEADLTRIGPGRPEAEGQKLVIQGRLLDEALRPVRHTLMEVWNCNIYGRYSHADDQGNPEARLDPNFYGFGRVVTDDEGRYSFRTIRPAPYIARRDIGWWRPPHVHFSILGGGTRLVTQMYFPDEPLNVKDFIFDAIPSAERQRVIAVNKPAAGSELLCEHNIVVRGQYQTPWDRF